MVKFSSRWITKKGYVRGRIPDYPFPRTSGLMYEHIAVIELHLKRRLEPWEHVHHRDEDKQHNLLPNLEVQEARQHNRQHARRQARDRVGKYIPPVVDAATDPFDDLDF